MGKIVDIVREYFPNKDDTELMDIAWGFTGYPHWWQIPEDGNTPEECFRKQLALAKKGFENGGTFTAKGGWEIPDAPIVVSDDR